MTSGASKKGGPTVTNEQLNAEFDRMAKTVLRIKREHAEMAVLLRGWANYDGSANSCAQLFSRTNELLASLDSQ